jgi:hypothetical protein
MQKESARTDIGEGGERGTQFRTKIGILMLENKLEQREFFEQVALIGPAVFYSSAFSEDELPSLFAESTADTAREHVVLRTLAEVQKFGAACRRWREEEDRCGGKNRLNTLILESLVVDQVAWQRRLLEALITLINFSHSNEQPYYAHYLSLKRFERENSRVNNERDFFGEVSKLTRLRIDSLRTQLEVAEARVPNRSECWYVDPNNMKRSLTIRRQFLLALRHAIPAERIALGYTYKDSFGAASEELHFNILDAEPQLLDGADHGYRSAVCGLLSIAIICRAHELCEVDPEGVNRYIMRSENRRRQENALLSTQAKVGDFVVSNGPNISEVMEIRTGEFGYESCRVRFLETTNDYPDLAEDWLPAPALQLFMSRDALVEETRKQLQINGLSDVEPQEVQEAVREGVLEAWRLGLREYVIQHTRSTE